VKLALSLDETILGIRHGFVSELGTSTIDTCTAISRKFRLAVKTP